MVSELWYVQEIASDELMVPTRGPDWDDEGMWRELTQHNWTASHRFLGDVWNELFRGIHRSNAAVDGLGRAAGRGNVAAEQYHAEARFLRVFFYWQLMDVFGDVPLVTTLAESRSIVASQGDDLAANTLPRQRPRSEVYSFIIQELTGCSVSNFQPGGCVERPSSKAIIPNLEVEGNVPVGRATQGAAYSLLATLLLNAEVYTGDISERGIQPGTALYRGASAAADQVINSGRYQLEDYFENFAGDNSTSNEIIFSIPQDVFGTIGNEPPRANRVQNSMLHYNHPIGTTPWNGFTTIAEFYKSYDSQPGPDGKIGTADDIHSDVRGKSFLVGKQYQAPAEGCSGDECFNDPSSGEVTVRGEDTPLNLTLEIPGIRLGEATAPPNFPSRSRTFLLEAPGARPLKFEIDPDRRGSWFGNDVPLFRLAEMYLIKAEAEANLGNMEAALDAFNEVHTERGNDALAMGEVDGQMGMIRQVIAERGRELMLEGKRRSDLIRYEYAHGGEPAGPPYTSKDDPYVPTFTGPWLFKKDGSDTGRSSSPYRVVFPVPKEQLDTNPKLTQNPGY